MMLLMIDNYDSFTYNLVQYFSELQAEVHVYRNDQLTLEQIAVMNPDWIVISPGPCTPNEAGISLQLIQQFSGKIPILGVCLGHQSIAQVFGSKIIRAQKVMHGKVSPIYHNNAGVFKNLPSPFNATRYHSLLIDANTLSPEFAVTAWTQDEAGGMYEIMGIRHRTLPLEGVQFHPESILTEHGHALLRNFLAKTKKGLTDTLLAEPA